MKLCALALLSVLVSPPAWAQQEGEPAGAAVLEGRVHFGGRGLEGIHVYAYTSADPDPNVSAVTDAEGRYRLLVPRPPPRDSVIIARQEGPRDDGIYAYSPYCCIPLAPGKVKGWDFAMNPAGAVTGQVVLPNGSPAADVRITVHSLFPVRSLRTDADGRYWFAETSNPYSLVAAPSGRLDFGSIKVNVSVVIGEVRHLNFTLPGPTILRGVVRHADGAPVPGAGIELLAGRGASAGGRHHATAADGSYAIPVEPGAYGLRVDPPRDARASSPLARVEVPCDAKDARCLEVPAETTKWLNVTLAHAHLVSGRVVAEKDVILDAAVLRTVSGPSFDEAVLDPSGTFSLRLANGSYAVRLIPQFGPPLERPCREEDRSGCLVVAGATTADVTFTSERAGGARPLSDPVSPGKPEQTPGPSWVLALAATCLMALLARRRFRARMR